MARRESHAISLTRIPCGDNQAAAIGHLLNVIDHPSNLIYAASIRPPPVSPLRAVDSAKIAVLIGPLLPNGNPIFT